MSALALHETHRESGAVRTTVTGVKRWRLLIIGFAFGFPVVFYLLLLAIPVIRYDHLPNYVTPYDWISNVERIIESTGSVRDMVPIILDEWLLEIGYMDMDYGHGIAEWSLSLAPHKILLVSLTGGLIGLNVGLMLDRLEAVGTAAQQCVRASGSGVLTSVGALCTGLTNATLFSIACCSTPSWVGSLSILGVETSSAFALEPYGPAGSVVGMAMLVVSALWLARAGRRAALSAPRSSAQGVPSC
jgi:hypothetical protein